MTETPAPDDSVVDRFPPTNGRFTGILGLVTAAVVLVVAVLDWDAGTPLGVAILAALGGCVVWVAVLRPALWTTSQDLVMRGMLHTDRIPLAAVEQVTITQVLTVEAAGRRYLSPVIGYSARQSVKRRMGVDSAATPSNSTQQFVEDRILHLAQDTRERQGISTGSPEQQALVVRRSWAWPEIGGCSLLGLALVVWLLL